MKAISEHLKELRYRIIIIIIYFILFLFIGISLSPLIIKKIISGLVIANVELVSLSPLEFIYTQIKVGFIFSLIFTLPAILYHLIIFIKPGLKNREIIAISYIMPGFILLFILGIMFSYFIFLKASLFFLAKLSSLAAIENLWSINKFVSFILAISFALGMIFQLPLALLLLKKLNIIKVKALRKYRAHVYVFAFVISAIITPPDIVTMILISLPLIILYELSLFVMKLF